MTMKRITTFEAVRKPIYIAEVTANGKDFPFTLDVAKLFKERNEEYADCDYDSTYNNGIWTLRFYRECAIDFVPTR